MPIEPHIPKWFPIHLHCLPDGLRKTSLCGMALNIEPPSCTPQKQAHSLRQSMNAADRIQHAIASWQITKPKNWPDCPVIFSLEGHNEFGPIGNLRKLRDTGLRSIQPHHPRKASRYLSPFSGLSDEGQALLRSMANCALLLDLSHLYGPLLEHVLQSAPGKKIVSHVVCGDMLKKSITVRANAMSHEELVACRAELYGIPFIDDILFPDGIECRARKATIQLVARHIIRMADVVGIEKVALGPDFFDPHSMQNDGVGIVPGMDRPEGLIQLRAELASAGWLPSSIDAVFFENARRVFLVEQP